VDLQVPVCAGKQDLCKARQVIEPETQWKLKGSRSVELQVVLPILHVVGCSAICIFKEVFASCWLWDPVGAFCGPLIFLCQDSCC
jgi:hypothetical protein